MPEPELVGSPTLRKAFPERLEVLLEVRRRNLTHGDGVAAIVTALHLLAEWDVGSNDRTLALSWTFTFSGIAFKELPSILTLPGTRSQWEAKSCTGQHSLHLGGRWRRLF